MLPIYKALTSDRQVPSEVWQFEYEVKTCTGKWGELRPQEKMHREHNFKT